MTVETLSLLAQRIKTERNYQKFIRNSVCVDLFLDNFWTFLSVPMFCIAKRGSVWTTRT